MSPFQAINQSRPKTRVHFRALIGLARQCSQRPKKKNFELSWQARHEAFVPFVDRTCGIIRILFTTEYEYGCNLHDTSRFSD
jgi:hypothetical protein